MSFVPKLLILVGWMLIFPVGVVDSASLIDKLAGLDQTVMDDISSCLGDNLQTLIERLQDPTSDQTDGDISSGGNSTGDFAGLKTARVSNCPPGPNNSVLVAETGNSDKNENIYEIISYSEKSELILSLAIILPVNITKDELNTILVPFLIDTKVPKDKYKKNLIPRTAQFFQDLERQTSGGPASANSSKGLFSSTIAAIIAAVALRLGTIICS